MASSLAGPGGEGRVHSVVRRGEREGFPGWFPGIFRFLGEGWENKSMWKLD